MNVRELRQKISPIVCESSAVEKEDIVVSPDAVNACRQNYCGRYGKSWSCPPGADGEKVLRRLRMHAHALLFSTVHPLEDSYDAEGMERGREAHAHVQAQVVALAGCTPQDALGAGSCTVCGRCTYPHAPCRFPTKMTRSVESCGISVVDLCQKTGLAYTHGPNTVTYFSLVFFD